MKKELVKKAQELGIDMSKYEDDEEGLEAAVEEAEKAKKQDKDPEYLESELKKVIEQRDQAKKDRNKFREEMKKMKEKLSGMPDPDEFTKLQEEFENLKTFKTQKEKEEEEKELEKKTDAEKAEIKFKKQMEDQYKEFQSKFDDAVNSKKKLEEELEKAKSEVSQLRGIRRDKEIWAAAAKHGAYSEDQIVKLTKNDFKYDKDTDRYYVPVYDDKGKMVDMKYTDEYIAEYLGREDNENLVKSKANTDSFQSHKEQPSSDVKNTTANKNSKYDPKDEKLKREADEKGLSVDELISYKEIRDKKMFGHKTKEGET